VSERKARKEHICTLCQKVIKAGKQYEYQRLTPWDHSENEYFFDYKAHISCDTTWHKVGCDYDWVFPAGKYEWAEMTEGMAAKEADK
jgi:hypothetical protein